MLILGIETSCDETGIALYIINEAERSGLLKKGSTIIETTSGNTGFSIAMISLIKGYNCILAVSSKSSKDKIDSLEHLIINAFVNTKRGVYRLRYLQNIRKNIIPLSVLTLIQKQLNLIKKERNILLISEFNSIISKEIKSQPAPFLYERIGEKFKNYSIDEFQDTSKMQWDNLFPLITNALANSSNSVLIVGDPKLQ